MSTRYSNDSSPILTRYSGSAELLDAIRSAAVLAYEIAPQSEFPDRYRSGRYPFTVPAEWETGEAFWIGQTSYTVVNGQRIGRDERERIVCDGPACKWPMLKTHPESPGPFLPAPGDRRVTFHYQSDGSRGSMQVKNARACLLDLADKVHANRAVFDGKVKKTKCPDAVTGARGSAPHVAARALWAERDYAGAIALAQNFGAVFVGAGSKPGEQGHVYMRAESVDVAGHPFVIARSIASGKFQVVHVGSGLSVNPSRLEADPSGYGRSGFISHSAALDWVETAAQCDAWRDKLHAVIAKSAPLDQCAALAHYMGDPADKPAQDAASEAAARADAPPTRETTKPAPEAARVISVSASWVIREKATGAVIMETFDRRKVDALNTDKYEAVPIIEHLAGLSRCDPTPEVSPPTGELKTSSPADDGGFSQRVTMAAAYIGAGRKTSRAFDSCFEMWDGDAVSVALLRRAENRPGTKLAANLWRYLNRATVDAAASRQPAGMSLADWSRALVAPHAEPEPAPAAAPVSPTREYEPARTRLELLALIGTDRSCRADDDRELTRAGLIRTARDGWIDLTQAGRLALTEAGYTWRMPWGWKLTGKPWADCEEPQTEAAADPDRVRLILHNVLAPLQNAAPDGVPTVAGLEGEANRIDASADSMADYADPQGVANYREVARDLRELASVERARLAPSQAEKSALIAMRYRETAAHFSDMAASGRGALGDRIAARFEARAAQSDTLASIAPLPGEPEADETIPAPLDGLDVAELTGPEAMAEFERAQREPVPTAPAYREITVRMPTRPHPVLRIPDRDPRARIPARFAPCYVLQA